MNTKDFINNINLKHDKLKLSNDNLINKKDFSIINNCINNNIKITEKTNKLVDDIMKVSFIMLYGNDNDGSNVISNGVFSPVGIDDNFNVVYKRLNCEKDVISYDKSEELRVPISNVLKCFKESTISLASLINAMWIDSYFSMVVKESQEQENFVGKALIGNNTDVIHSFDELHARYSTNGIKRGDNYELVPFIIGEMVEIKLYNDDKKKDYQKELYLTHEKEKLKKEKQKSKTLTL